MKQNKINVILTGCTGTLGSQVFYELLQQDNIKHIYLPVREKNGKSALDRVQKILNSDASPSFITENKKLIAQKIRALDMVSFFKPETFLSKNETNFFIHSAGSVNLTTDKSQRDVVFNGVYEFTKEVFNTFSSFITKFTYISTAFSIGNIGGLIDNDYHAKKKPKYRNFYEEAKHTTEKFLLKKGQENKVSIQILRPSVLGGNIFNKSPYFISNYMVYYLLGNFFYKNPLANNPIRITTNFKTGLNIIPVDYVAKIIATVYQQKIEQLNIVHSKSTNIVTGMKRILKTVDFNNFTFLNSSTGGSLLKSKNRLENIYYKTIGLHLNQYLISDPYEYDTNLLESILPIPKYNTEDYLENTISYAKSKDFKGEDW
ncbi:SDR family oxidoreductase [Tenacibaculum pacificus]|uniref:SDR family oxidoreductase n=1 Tax=Tenacibaculum pacificus TaxID=3018314 RepID=UPI0022F3B884|nr:SDR family oxidoreductase [Tenacibaculum pacificus]WBX73558.1 SDR family oxidoreductase [Tenacibaculum pacificus]